MKKLATAVAVAGFFETTAFAAAMAVKGPAPAPAAAVYNWTGWYAGVNAGASFGNVKTDFNAAPVSVATNFVPTFNVPGFAGSAGCTQAGS